MDTRKKYLTPEEIENVSGGRRLRDSDLTEQERKERARLRAAYEERLEAADEDNGEEFDRCYDEYCEFIEKMHNKYCSD